MKLHPFYWDPDYISLINFYCVVADYALSYLTQRNVRTYRETTMTQYYSVKDTAKLVRQALKEAFPGVKFGVRCSSYAGGASIGVT